MLHPIPILADFEVLRQQRQTLICSNARCENLRQLYRNYEVGDEVLVKVLAIFCVSVHI